MVAQLYKDRGRPDTSAIGDQGELWFASQLPRGWVWQPPRRDVGKDGLIVIRDGTELDNVEFSVQIKTTTSALKNSGSVAIRNVPRSSILYWAASTHPTLVVAVNLSTQSARYAWHFQVVDLKPKALASLPERVVLRIPTASILDSSGWDAIRIELHRCYSYLWNSTSKSDSFVQIVAGLNILSTSAQNLFTLSKSELPVIPLDEEQAITLLIEERIYQNILHVAIRTHRSLPPSASLHLEITHWLSQYREKVTRAFPQINLEPLQASDQIGTEIAFVRGELNECRSEALVLVFELMRLLSQIHPSGSHNDA